MTCLDDELVLGLVEGRLAAAALVGVDDHLDDCTACRDVVAHVARMRASSSVLDRGHALGRYVVGDLLGAGAMGRVYSAWEPELDRRVAIKVLQDDAPGARERLVREAQAMARLDHPNVVGVHEVGTSDRGVYVAMDLVDGETLRAWAERKPPWRAVARVLAEVARGLAAVHAAGVLHRDVKPDNVIVGTDGRARIGDFGLARSGPITTVAPRDGELSLATGTPATAIAGTPVYMAPEVLRGGAASPASDQFGFGVTAYEVLSGTRPFAGRTWSEIASAIDRGAIARLRGVPGWLEAAIRRCLAADPARRFSSLTAVGALIDDRARRRGSALWIAAAAGTAVLASAATWVALRRDPSPEASARCDAGAAQIATVWNPQQRGAIAVDAPALAAIDRWASAWATSRDGVCRAATSEPAAVIAARDRCLDRRRDELAALLGRVGAYGATPERLADALAALPPSECTSLALDAADPLPLDPAKAALVQSIEHELPAARAAVALGDARPVATAIAELVQRARVSGHEPTLAAALLLHADAARALSNLPEAAIAARDAAAAAERGHDDLGAARAWIARTTIAGDRRDLTAADDLGAIAAAAIDRAGTPRHLAAELARIRGLVAFNRGQLVAARTLLLEARTIYAALAGERSVEVAGVESSLGTVARAAGDIDEAERHHRLAFEIDQELRGATHPDLARDLHNLAGVQRMRGDLAKALELYHQALSIESATRGPRSVQSALTHNSIALVHMARGEWRLALADLEMARDVFRSAGHGDLAFAEHNLGITRAALGDHAAALVHFEAAAAAYAATIGDAADGPIRLLLDRARSQASSGAIGRARADATRAREQAEQARIPWIVEEADALVARLAKGGSRPQPIVTAQPIGVAPPPVETTPILIPPALPAPPPKPPEPPSKRPNKDVGVYGSSQGW